MDKPTKLALTIGDVFFQVQLEWEKAPNTAQQILKLLPFESKIIQARWSGDAAWVPMGEQKLNLQDENKKNAPSAGEILIYCGPISETEIYFPYGFNRFACKDGLLEGNHFATVLASNEEIVEIGKKILWQGAQKFSLRLPGNP